ncbi:MAG: T9SS type A sorting domain-containing protein, partial [Bacteroidales bacterium]|nr:T9SS type A sorting domain-containing protein [Bacteroidales bacterium]
EVQSICNYLASPNGEIEILDNMTGCNSQEEVEQACQTTSMEELKPSNYLVVNPNPFSTAITIEYELTQHGKTEIKILNQIGQIIKEFVHKESRIGTNKFIWQTENLPSGFYFIRLQIGAETLTKKIIKL